MSESSIDWKKNIITRDQFMALDQETRIRLIQQLIPIGLIAATEEFQREVEELSGGKYQRKGVKNVVTRHGTNPGSINIGGQQIPIRVPRIRKDGKEYTLESYKLLHKKSDIDNSLLLKVLYGLSCRNYNTANDPWINAIGSSKSAVSRHFITESNKTLKEFKKRNLGDLRVLVIFLDGKYFKDDQMVIALGVTEDGRKIFLGFAQCDTENSVAISRFLKGLLKRGLVVDEGVLVVIDGAPGLRSGVKAAFKNKVIIQRCQWHKRENVLEHISSENRGAFRGRLQRAYEQSSYNNAQKELDALLAELKRDNKLAYGSLKEGFAETLTLHKLKVFEKLGRSLKTNNCLESVNSIIGERCSKVDHWANANQKHRWLATSLLDAEPRLKRIIGYKHLGLLKKALKKMLAISTIRR